MSKLPADVTGFISVTQRDIEWLDQLVPAQTTLLAKLTRLVICRWRHRWEVRVRKANFGSTLIEELLRNHCWACKLPKHAEDLWPYYTMDALVAAQHKELTEYLKAKSAKHEAPAPVINPESHTLSGTYFQDPPPRPRSGGYPAPAIDDKTLANIKVPSGPAPGSGLASDETQVIPTLPQQYQPSRGPGCQHGYSVHNGKHPNGRPCE